ncbi:MAG TPA: HPr family phosphocarrier protein [Planctomycetes bacterium]|nr:HPr family phosphocarrier protein [Planctomycetota bacterium]HIK60808.1 HPr family phosphocarrier protein [Planctomycetota bacterium]
MLGQTPEGSLEQLVPERDFANLFGSRAQDLLRLTNTLSSPQIGAWTKRLFFLLYSEADELESFLDDYGARSNQSYAPVTELVASIRGFSMAGLSLEHLIRRLDNYQVLESLSGLDADMAREDLTAARRWVQDVLVALLGEIRAEAERHGVPHPKEGHEEGESGFPLVRFRLPRDVGLEDIAEEEQRIAEVASKYLQACTMLDEGASGIIEEPAKRDTFLRESLTEETARVYTATVHNLQSTYDTYIGNTRLESADERLPKLRGHVSGSLHLLEAATQLVHFLERHESEVRDDGARSQLARLAPRAQVSNVILNVLLLWAGRLMAEGRVLAEDLLPSYTNLQVLDVELGEGLVLHARPISLVVSIVVHYATPVEFEVAGVTCSAGSILEMMIAAGSKSDEKRFRFRGDERPLRDIALLFHHDLGEGGTDTLPPELGYLSRA